MWIVLALILVFGFYIRVYHINYPVIGYHNWKETHYLTEARNFARNGEWLAPNGGFSDIFVNPEGYHVDTLPVTSWVTAVGFIFFGEEVWVGRLISVLFVMASIVLLYLIMKKLFKREDLALTTALIAATNPLLVFFGRQVQLINPALFFGMLSIYLYLLWLDAPEDRLKTKYIVAASISFMICFLTKQTFALLAVPIFFLLPFNKLKQKSYLQKNWKIYLYAILPLILIPLWSLNGKRIISEYSLSGIAAKIDVYYNLSTLFTSKFWGIMKPYAADNYSLIGVFFAVIGLALLIAFYRKKIGGRFVLAYAIGAIPWGMVMGSKLSGHNYHQYPIAPLIIILIAFCFVVIAGTIEKIVKIKHSRWLIIAVFFLLLMYPPIFKYGGGIFQAKDRMFDTQFYGLDIAGEYIKKNSQPDERIFFSGHQSHGIVWEADRRGYGVHYNESVTQYGEENFNTRWVFVYQWGLNILQQPEKWDHIKNIYSLRQIAFQQTPQGPQILYMLFEKGGSFNETSINDLLQQKQQTGQQKVKNYELTKGNVQVIYFDV
ncbi:ArnT family glycosyltransferase [candidate division KSB1 bacterium]